MYVFKLVHLMTRVCAALAVNVRKQFEAVFALARVCMLPPFRVHRQVRKRSLSQVGIDDALVVESKEEIFEVWV